MQTTQDVLAIGLLGTCDKCEQEITRRAATHKEQTEYYLKAIEVDARLLEEDACEAERHAEEASFYATACKDKAEEIKGALKMLRMLVIENECDEDFDVGVCGCK